MSKTGNNINDVTVQRVTNLCYIIILELFQQAAVWLSANVLGRIDEVTRVRLVLRWVTVFELTKPPTATVWLSL